uniref:EF-hand domain-containing protein n=1 Tax=Acanthochromis polyacanthus TaxID=80966 RepID=A0A3Q1FFP4_9TELE
DLAWIQDSLLPTHTLYSIHLNTMLKVLFQVLDVNGDGGICVNDLTIGLKKLGVHRTEHDSEEATQTSFFL